MQIFNTPEAQDADPKGGSAETTSDPLHRFRNWRGFLVAAIAVNLLFLYGMWHNTADPGVAIWFKVLVWLPFNAIATALYLVFLFRLGKPSEANHQTGGAMYALISLFMIGTNWALLIAA